MKTITPLRALWKNYASEADQQIMSFFLDSADGSCDADDHIRAFEKRIRNCPGFYTQQNKGEDAVCWFAYKVPKERVPAKKWQDEWWFVIELDPKTKDAFCLLKSKEKYKTGFLNVQELIDDPDVSVVLFFEPLTIREIKRRFKCGEPLENLKDD